MTAIERRIHPRFRLHASMSFHRLAPIADALQRARTINISTRGVFFATPLALVVGDAVEVLLKMPKRITGVKTGIRRFAGRVAHVEPKVLPQDLSGVGVQFLYYECDLVAITLH